MLSCFRQIGLLFCLLPTFCLAESRVDFDTDIIPVLTKAGCNSGACHGAAAGRGEFYLSLYGSQPAFDFGQIVHALRGRRVNLARPDESLIVLKATESISHGGGTRVDLDAPAYALLTRWIGEESQRLELRKLDTFTVLPGREIVARIGEEITVRTEALFSDGTSRDVTAWTVMTSEDNSAVTVDSQTARVKVKRSGRHVIIARYLNQVVPVVFLVPSVSTPDDPADLAQRSFIDSEIDQLLRTLRIPVSGPADDATFVRRVTLDLTGRLPAASVVTSFLNNSDRDKREKLVDRLLVSDEFTEYWTYYFAKLLRMRSQPQDTQGTRTYHSWLRHQIEGGIGYDEICKQLITAEGDSHLNGPPNFYRTVSGPRELAEFISEVFLGSRLRCANCHDHPLDRWTQDDYHGLAAVFAGVRSGRVVTSVDNGEVIHPKTGQPAVARIPGEAVLDNQHVVREELTDWLIDNGNPFFAKAIVNRLWKALMGRGLVEPVDDFRMTNPATHPALLDRLAEDFVAHDYDIRHTLKTIATSAVYARSEQVTAGNETDDKFYSHALVRPLEPEVLADAIADVTGISFSFPDHESGTRAITLFDPKIDSTDLDILGRCSREESCEDSTTTVGSLPRVLHQLNGDLLNTRIEDSDSSLHKLFRSEDSNKDLIQAVYLRAYGRLPLDEERSFWEDEFAAAQTDVLRTQIFRDFVWAVLSSREFVTNH